MDFDIKLQQTLNFTENAELHCFREFCKFVIFVRP